MTGPTGGAVTLAAGVNTVRVGDGTTAGAAFEAVIASELTGAGRLDKTDGGTLVLTGADTWVPAEPGSAAGPCGWAPARPRARSSAVSPTRACWPSTARTALTFGGAISGAGAIEQIGSSSTVLTRDSSAFTGRAHVRAGTLAVDGALGGTVVVVGGGRR